ncbi:hypothetical protein SAMN04488523_101172 [Sulfitobacter brevis]|uniref:Uncharacterized protein n=1 Tax=Sulfitobacter brevis TaxID=74348 RepID=A0A1I1SV32_9RHOB|nr:hypothetical protein SAMN04488523_101172 [Sulfitobacter brevis]
MGKAGRGRGATYPHRLCPRRRCTEDRAFGPEKLPDPGDIGCAVAVSEEAIVADAVLASGEHVDQKAAGELWRCQRHGRLATRAFEAVIFDAEGDAARIETDQAAVGNGHPVRVARQIGQHGFGPGEGFFGVNDPVDLAQRLQESIECRAINEPSMFSKEFVAFRLCVVWLALPK